MSDTVFAALLGVTGAVLAALIGAVADIVSATVSGRTRKTEQAREPGTSDRRSRSKLALPSILLMIGLAAGLVLGFIIRAPKPQGNILFADDFGGEGHIDLDRWFLQAATESQLPDCNVSQSRGNLIVGSLEGGEDRCLSLLRVRQFAEASLQDFSYIEARLLDPGGAAEDAFIALDVSAGNVSGSGIWIARCGLQTTSAGEHIAFLRVRTAADGDEYWEGYPATVEEWHILRFEVDSGTLGLNCWIDNRLITTYVPEDAAALRDKQYSVGLGGSLSEHTFQVDEFRIGRE